MTFEEFKADVDRLMKASYGIDWHDACGDPDPIERAIENGESPEEFVDWWAEKTGLTTISHLF